MKISKEEFGRRKADYDSLCQYVAEEYVKHENANESSDDSKLLQTL